MKTSFVFAFFILTTYTPRINSGERMNDILTKFHHRRAAGILAQPRVGRTVDMPFPHVDGASGLVHYPRVGRFDPLLLPTTLNDRKQFTNLQNNAANVFNFEAAIVLTIQNEKFADKINIKFRQKSTIVVCIYRKRKGHVCKMGTYQQFWRLFLHAWNNNDEIIFIEVETNINGRCIYRSLRPYRNI
ncbi:CAPA peptides-like [Chelonus insularis]|uniref:CAPA peptides-like n=1 Tax=Chelonus insularis TaxID=460826 RepID=UPI00158B15DD|nr:CAPA peptides-like [Chelonus insularis]